MQISQVKQTELGLLITGLRAIYVADHDTERRNLLVQLETELSTRYGTAIGKPDEQERNRAA